MLITTMNSYEGWLRIKKLCEKILSVCKNSSEIFSRTKKIKTDSDPDTVIDGMFAELMAVQYLLGKGCRNITYFKENNVDLTAEFNGKNIGIEVTYVSGADYKFQDKLFDCNIAKMPVYSLDSLRLINKLKSCYKIKEEQVLKHGYDASNSVIIIVSGLLEIYEPSLSHDVVNGKHPILYFVSNNKISTIVYGPSIYEPDNDFCNGFFDRLVLKILGSVN